MNLRDPAIFGPILGARLIDVTSEGADEDDENGNDHVLLHFDNGYQVRFPSSDRENPLAVCDIREP